ncbi:glycosyltransferase family 2 protein [Mycolicibacterium hodleri]|uniref:Glycosyltransferase n=1 Tax=Mycolicibacterium hodleri TaxID=49897 RepID=A0A502E4F4_9MYCO|nr:glycosyltransferase [Mycolicibacterium hodleri]TPG31436.1 glycosyltransferase [Mycolicibacterium hodleri]
MSDTTATSAVDVTVVMACYTEDRWTSITAALESLRRQRLAPRHVIVGVDNNRALATRLATEFDWLVVALNDGDHGASATRNRAADLVTTPFLAFLDDDEIAEPDWLDELTRPFVDAGVVGTGGRYRDVWLIGKPDWFPGEFAWVVGGAYVGMSTVTSEVRNVWSGNMAVRTDVFRAVGGFPTDFGKRGDASQPEDTELCIRMAQTCAGRWMYVPSAVIDHEVPEARSSLSFFARRCYTEGAGKALMRSRFDTADIIDTERSYAVRTTWAAMRRMTVCRRASLLQGMAMFLGLACAAVGFGREVTRSLVRRSGRGPLAPVELPSVAALDAADGAA